MREKIMADNPFPFAWIDHWYDLVQANDEDEKTKYAKKKKKERPELFTEELCKALYYEHQRAQTEYDARNEDRNDDDFRRVCALDWAVEMIGSANDWTWDNYFCKLAS